MLHALFHELPPLIHSCQPGELHDTTQIVRNVALAIIIVPEAMCDTAVHYGSVRIAASGPLKQRTSGELTMDLARDDVYFSVFKVSHIYIDR